MIIQAKLIKCTHMDVAKSPSNRRKVLTFVAVVFFMYIYLSTQMKISSVAITLTNFDLESKIKAVDPNPIPNLTRESNMKAVDPNPIPSSTRESNMKAVDPNPSPNLTRESNMKAVDPS